MIIENGLQISRVKKVWIKEAKEFFANEERKEKMERKQKAVGRKKLK